MLFWLPRLTSHCEAAPSPLSFARCQLPRRTFQSPSQPPIPAPSLSNLQSVAERRESESKIIWPGYFGAHVRRATCFSGKSGHFSGRRASNQDAIQMFSLSIAWPGVPAFSLPVEVTNSLQGSPRHPPGLLPGQLALPPPIRTRDRAISVCESGQSPCVPTVSLSGPERGEKK